MKTNLFMENQKYCLYYFWANLSWPYTIKTYHHDLLDFFDIRQRKINKGNNTLYYLSLNEEAELEARSLRKKIGVERMFDDFPISEEDVGSLIFELTNKSIQNNSEIWLKSQDTAIIDHNNISSIIERILLFVPDHYRDNTDYITYLAISFIRALNRLPLKEHACRPCYKIKLGTFYADPNSPDAKLSDSFPCTALLYWYGMTNKGCLLRMPEPHMKNINSCLNCCAYSIMQTLGFVHANQSILEPITPVFDSLYDLENFLQKKKIFRDYFHYFVMDSDEEHINDPSRKIKFPLGKGRY